MIIEGNVWRGNNRGSGFVKIPTNVNINFSQKDNIKVEIIKGTKILNNFYGSISSYKRNFGFYIPQKICLFHNILGKALRFNVKKIEGFYSDLGNEGRLYIQNNIAEKLELKEGDIILVKGSFENSTIENLCKLRFRQRADGRKEYFCFFSPKFKNKSGIFNIKRKLIKERIKEPLISLLNNINYGSFDKSRVIIIHHKSRLDINSKIKMDKDLSFYLGCYFADGTKKNSWAITASTFEQAMFYKKMHESMILNPEYSSSYISITSKKNVGESNIKKLWKNFTGLEVNKVRQRISQSGAENINEYGSFVIRDNRRITLIYYQRLLNYLIKYIINKKDRKMATDFICGVFEGDGSPNAIKRGHIIISSNKKDSQILDDILKITALDYKIERSKNVYIRVNALGLLSQIEFLSNKIFKYYPKRRKKFVERFCNIGAVKFILGQQDHCSSWVKAWLKNECILNKNYEFTEKGKRIKDNLIDMINSVTVK